MSFISWIKIFGYGEKIPESQEATETSEILSIFLNSQKYTENELALWVNSFQNKFPGKNVKVLFLKEHITYCEQKKDCFLIRKAIEYFTKENLYSIADRKIALRWLLLFEELEPDMKRLGEACRAFNECFAPLKEGESKKRITAICRDDQKHPLSLLSLLTYEIFQKQLQANTEWISLGNTALSVVKVFEKYLDEGRVSKHAFENDPHLWAELFDIGRWISDVGLQKQCLFYFEEQFPRFYLKNPLMDVLEDGFKGHPELIKNNNGRALKVRTSDYLSHECLGKQFMKEQDFSSAWFHFKKASELAPFRPDLDLMALQALMEYGKQLKSKFQKFNSSASEIRKMVDLGENMEEEYDHLFNSLIKWSKKIGISELVFQKEDLLTKGIQSLQNQVNMKILSFFEGIQVDLKKYSHYPESKMNHDGIQALLLWLKGDFLLEKGELDEAKKIYNGLLTQHLDKEEKARLYCRLAKCSTSEQAVEFLLQGLKLDPSDTIKRELILLNSESALSLGPEFLKNYPDDTEVRFAYAASLFHQGNRIEAKVHFLECDPYSAHAHYYLGEMGNPAFYFKRALFLSREEPLERSHYLKMANYFLKNNPEEEVLIELIHQFLKAPQQERPWEIKYILMLLEKRIQNEEIKELVSKGHSNSIKMEVKPFIPKPLKIPSIKQDDSFIIVSLDNQGLKRDPQYIHDGEEI